VFLGYLLGSKISSQHFYILLNIVGAGRSRCWYEQRLRCLYDERFCRCFVIYVKRVIWQELLFDQIDRCRIISGRDIDDICLQRLGLGFIGFLDLRVSICNLFLFEYRVHGYAYIYWIGKGYQRGIFVVQELNNARRSLAAKIQIQL